MLRKSLLTLAFTAFFCGAAVSEPVDSIDPYQSFNRAMFKFNMSLQRYFISPVVSVYDTLVPSMARSGVGNFFSNVGMVSDIGNDALQTNWHFLGHDLVRFFLNTTLGLFGTIDVASQGGWYSHSQSFGMTLAKWGVVKSPYLVLPVLGPSTARDAFGLVPDYLMSPWYYGIKHDWRYYSLRALEFTQVASDMLPQQKMIMENAIDPYIALRNAYLQNRAYIIRQIKYDRYQPPRAKQSDQDDFDMRPIDK